MEKHPEHTTGSGQDVSFSQDWMLNTGHAWTRVSRILDHVQNTMLICYEIWDFKPSLPNGENFSHDLFIQGENAKGER